MQAYGYDKLKSNFNVLLSYKLQNLDIYFNKCKDFKIKTKYLETHYTEKTIVVHQTCVYFKLFLCILSIND